VPDKVLDLENIVSKDSLANSISVKYLEWNHFRVQWMQEKQEIRNYIFATDTSTTTNSDLPWKNKTTVPKLCQIRDNLHANYMAALFPNSNWLNWEGANDEAETKEKRHTIEQYMLSKTRQSNFRDTISRLVFDYIDYGNCFAVVDYIEEVIKDPNTDEETAGYVGPKLRRLSPFDVVFDPTAVEFENTPKIVRSVVSVGDLHKIVSNQPDKGYLNEAITEFIGERQQIVTALAAGDNLKDEAFRADGFSNMRQYYTGNYVEVLDFYGDIYDIETGKFYENYHITVVDQYKVIKMEENPSWIGKHPIVHTGWRHRPDNLYSMGPLDNLVGMQYRIDHLENLKADVFDLVAYPLLKIRGDVQDFVWAPGERAYLGDEGDVELVSPDVQALNANFEIQVLEQRMEELAGAPKNAMGIRTPGEKTAFEVQTLDNASSRIFQNKTSHFEEQFEEKVLNIMFEVGRRNLDGSDIVRVYDDEAKVVEFLNITKEDLSADGRFRPVGARHFAEQAQMVQNINNFYNSAIAADPAVKVHWSGKKMSKVMEELLNLESYGVVEDNVRVFEEQETQRLAQSANEQLGVEQLTPAGITEDDVDEQEIL